MGKDSECMEINEAQMMIFRKHLIVVASISISLITGAFSQSIPSVSIDAMYPSKDNKNVLSVLSRYEGKIIYVNTVFFEFQKFEPYESIEKNCYNNTSDLVYRGHFDDATIFFPIPNKSGNYKNYYCDYAVHFSMYDKRKLATSSLGTGSLAVIVRKQFLVSRTRNGGMTIFNLREI